MEEFRKLGRFYLNNSLDNSIKQLTLIKMIIHQRTKTANRIVSFSQGFLFRRHMKKVILIKYILINRNNLSNLISSFWKMTVFRRNIRRLIDDKEENYLLCLDSENSQQIRFTAEHDNGLHENFYYDYSHLIKSFIILIPKTVTIKYLKGKFYDNGSQFTTNQYPIIEEERVRYNVIDLNEYSLIEERLSDFKEEVISNFYKKMFKRQLIENYKKRSFSLKVINKISLSSNSNLKKTPSMSILQSNTKSILKPSNSHHIIVKRRISFGMVEYSY